MDETELKKLEEIKRGKLPLVELNDEDRKYLLGAHNKGIRFYYYIECGLGVINEFRNLFLGLAALYVGLHLENVLWIVVMFVPSIFVVGLIGRYNVHKLSKMKEWLNMRFSTHYGIKSFNYQEEQNELLKEIRDLLLKKQHE